MPVSPSLSRRRFLTQSLAVTGASCCIGSAQARRPNVVLILADDLGWSDLGCYGADLHSTPHIDRLAAESVRFTNAHSPSPVCSSTRAAILTGKNPARLHMTTWSEDADAPTQTRRLIPPRTLPDLPLAERTLAEILSEAGYRTGLIGKWHLGGAQFYPESQGFDVNIGGSMWGAPQTYFFPYRGTKHYGGEFRYVPHMEDGKSGDYLTDQLTRHAVQFIHTSDSRPFFLYLAHHAPHTPIEAKQETVARYRKLVRDGMHHRNAAYAAMIESLDVSVGRVLDALRETGVADNTIVIFASDNGGYIGKYDGEAVTDNYPLRSGKGSLYDGGTRVPLLIRGPGVRPGICDELVTLTDLFPTLLDLTGASAGRPEDGVSVTPLLKDATSKLQRDALFIHYPHYYPTTTPASAIRTREWKLIEYYEDGRMELFNYDRGVAETEDVAAQHPAKVEELRGRLRQWLRSVDAQMPAPNPNYKQGK